MNVLDDIDEYEYQEIPQHNTIIDIESNNYEKNRNHGNSNIELITYHQRFEPIKNNKENGSIYSPEPEIIPNIKDEIPETNINEEPKIFQEQIPITNKLLKIDIITDYVSTKQPIYFKKIENLVLDPIISNDFIIDVSPQNKWSDDFEFIEKND